MDAQRMITGARLVSVAVGILFTGATFADECTNQLNGWLAGKETAATMKEIPEARRQQAAAEVVHIKSARQHLSDCDVAATVPELRASREAFDNAVKAYEQQRQQ